MTIKRIVYGGLVLTAILNWDATRAGLQAAEGESDAGIPKTLEADKSEAQTKVNWVGWSDEVIPKAQKDGKLIYVDVYADWCGPCKEMDASTFRDKAVVEKLNRRFIAVKVNADKDLDATRRFCEGGLPTSVILTGDGKLINRQEGYLPADHLSGMLEKALNLVADIARLEKEIAEEPGQLAKTRELAEAYLNLEDASRALPLLQRVWDRKGDLAENDTRPVLFMLGLAHLMGREYAQAVARFGEYKERYPEHASMDRVQRLLDEATFHLAEEQGRDGKTEEAIRNLEALIARNPDERLVAECKRRRQGLLLLGKLAPILSVSEWISGDATTLQKLKGKVVLLDIFQIVCPGCRKVHPHIVQMQKRFGGQGLQVVGIASAFELQHVQSAEHIGKYVRQDGTFNYPVAVDRNGTDTFNAYVAKGTPFAVLIDRSGNVRWADFYDPRTVEAKLADLLAENP